MGAKKIYAMLTETKITIAVATAGGNSALGVSINELLRIYLLGRNESEEVQFVGNDNIKTIQPTRIKVATASFKEGSESNLDPRAVKGTNPTNINSRSYISHTAYELSHISKYRAKLPIWNENKDWWENTYKQRKYMIQNRASSTDGLQFKEGFSSLVIWYTNFKSEVYINQFCYVLYGSGTQFNKYKDLFWLICSIDGKNPEKDEPEKEVSSAEKAKFPIDNSGEKEITYMTLEQAKKKPEDKEKIKVAEKNKFVVWDWKKDWWEWSYQYRLQKDKSSENSAFPLSEKFRKITKDWDEKANDETALNKACKDFYESSSSSDDETEDAWRYCSIEGKQSN